MTSPESHHDARCANLREVVAITTWWQPTVRSKNMVQRLLFCSFSNASRQVVFFFLWPLLKAAPAMRVEQQNRGREMMGRRLHQRTRVA